MPGRKKIVPPLRVQMKFCVQTDGMVSFSKAAKKVDHSGPHHFGA